MTTETESVLRLNLPVFLVGCHRSGTTLARVVLNAHPRIACPPESKFIAGLRSFMEYPQLHTAFRSLGLSATEVHSHLKAFTVTILDSYARSYGKLRWIDKPPNYYNCLDFIDEIFSEEVLSLFMIRHPFVTIQSLEGWGRGSYFFSDPEIERHVQSNGAGRFSWAKYWKDVNDRLFTFAAGHPERSKLFRYEDLVRDPETTLREILECIGEQFSPNMIAHAFAADLKAKGFGDSKVRGTSSVHSKSVGKWRDWPHGERDALWRIVGETANLIGYLKEI